MQIGNDSLTPISGLTTHVGSLQATGRIAAQSGLTVSGGTFLSRGISDGATGTVLSLSSTAVSVPLGGGQYTSFAGWYSGAPLQVGGGSITTGGSTGILFTTITPSGAFGRAGLLSRTVGDYRSSLQLVYTSDADNEGGIFFCRSDVVTRADVLLARLSDPGHLLPGADNTQDLGGSDRRWAQLRAGTSTIATSHGPDKVVRGPLTPAEVAAGRELAGLVVAYQWAASADRKGAAGARMHCGWVAQEVAACLERHGLDPAQYGLWCADPETETVTEEQTVSVPVTTTVSRPYSRVEVVDGQPVLVAGAEEVEEPVVDLVPVRLPDGQPAMESVPALDHGGQPVVDAAGVPVLVQRPMLHPVARTRQEVVQVPVTRTVLDDTGSPRYRQGLRYEELLAFVLAAVAASP